VFDKIWYYVQIVGLSLYCSKISIKSSIFY